MPRDQATLTSSDNHDIPHLTRGASSGKLTYLDNNIKCGNSLIDDPAVAGADAFKWKKEFAEIMRSGGFDVVVGNPPYIPIEMLSESHKDFFKAQFDVLERKYDSSVVFILHGLSLIKETGYLSYISSVTWQTGENYPKLRALLFQEFGVKTVVNLPFDIFPDAYVETCAYVLSRRKTKSYKIFCFDKNAVPIGLDSLDYEEIKISSIRAPDFKLVLNSASNNTLDKIRTTKGMVTLGQITRSTQGLSASRYSLSAKKTARV